MHRTTRMLAILGAAALTAACEGSSGFVTSSSLADSTTGGVSGTVTTDGVTRSGVQVVAVGAQRDSATTDATGVYRIRGLSPGQYSVTVQVPIGYVLAPGQAGTETANVAAGAFASADFALQRATANP